MSDVLDVGTVGERLKPSAGVLFFPSCKLIQQGSRRLVLVWCQVEPKINSKQAVASVFAVPDKVHFLLSSRSTAGIE